MSISYADDLVLAHLLANAADKISLARFGALDLVVTTKPDLTPVSDADTEVERTLREILASHRPTDTIVGEEFGASCAGPDTSPQSRQRRWIIDPIDGTKNFIRGVPIWATLIALFDDNEPVLGLVSAPALDRRWWAAAGSGAHLVSRLSHQSSSPASFLSDASPLRVSHIGTVADASLCYASLHGWEQLGRLDAMIDLMRATWRQRGYGDFFGYMLLAEGALDICVEPELSLWDIAALIPIVREAGGMFTDLGGRPSPGDGSSVATNGWLHPEVLRRLGHRTLDDIAITI